MATCPHFDLTDPETYQGGVPREVFKYLRSEQPLFWHDDPETDTGFWAVTQPALGFSLHHVPSGALWLAA